MESNKNTVTPGYLQSLSDWYPTQQTEWAKLERLSGSDQKIDSVERMELSLAGISVDFSKLSWNQQVLDQFVALAEKSPVQQGIRAMFAGDHINFTEDRPALHVALRGEVSEQVSWQGVPVNRLVAEQKQKMFALAEKLRGGEWIGATGKPITDVVNLGVGGSDLGPRMVCDALQDEASGTVRVHFAATLDGTELKRVLKHCDPEATLFVVVSKTFTTIDTMRNFQFAQQWAVEVLDKSRFFQSHVIAVSANTEAMSELGVPKPHQLTFFDWVGGRYSLWSTVGVSIAIALGEEAFQAMLDGAKEIDEHMVSAPLNENLPLMLALADVWNANFAGLNHRLILPYDFRLRMLPDYLQQLVLESNGKQITASGGVCARSALGLWGGYGPVMQHAFFQWMHQGTEAFSAEFFTTDKDELERNSATAQMKVLAQGDQVLDEAPVSQHQSYHGGRPYLHWRIPELNAKTLGALIAIFEHRVFLHSVLLGINAFDQFGVELGKKVLKQL